MNMNSPGDTFANVAVWYTIVFKLSTFYFLGGEKVDFETVCLENPKFNPYNHYTSSTVIFAILLSLQSLCAHSLY